MARVVAMSMAIGMAMARAVVVAMVVGYESFVGQTGISWLELGL